MATINLNKLLFIILIIKSSLFVDALKCYQCGMYNEGVGSITPCLNYTEATAPNYLKDCPKSSDNYCIVSSVELYNLFIHVPVFSCISLYFSRNHWSSFLVIPFSVVDNKILCITGNFMQVNCSYNVHFCVGRDAVL